MVADKRNVYVFGRRQKYWRWVTGLEYRLFSVPRSLPPPNENSQGAAFATRWSVDAPLLARAMLKAGDTIFVCGAADVVDEPKAARQPLEENKLLERQSDLFAGKGDGVLWAVSAEDGKEINRARFDFLPVFDGMIAADGKLFVSTVAGEVVCVGK